VAQVYETIDKLQEVNPMLGFRGCRLGITYPEITEMQVRYGVQGCLSSLPGWAVCSEHNAFLLAVWKQAYT
jgi:pyruvate,orthophosphate dikinase